MNERSGKPRPLPPAAFDDPSIPVLTERLLLPELDLDTSLPVDTLAADEGAAAGQATAAPAATPLSRPEAAASTTPQVLGVDFETDTWRVEPNTAATPAAPARLDVPLPAAAAPAAIAPAAIPASLMRASAAPATAVAAPQAGAGIDSGKEEQVAADARRATPEPPAWPDAAQLSASILDQLLRNLPPDAEPIVRRHLAPAVDAAIGAAVAQIVPEIRRAVAVSLRELVEQTLQAELARLRERSRP